MSIGNSAIRQGTHRSSGHDIFESLEELGDIGVDAICIAS